MTMHTFIQTISRFSQKLSRHRIFPFAFAAFAVFFFQTMRVDAQLRPFTVTGGLTLSTEFNSTNSADPAFQSRAPQNASRAVLHTTVTLFDQVQLPFEAYITTYSRGYGQPFNQFGVSPLLFGWLRLHGGYFTARLSELTFGDERLLGGGVEMNPGKFHFTALYGASRRARSTDSATGISGEYHRTIVGARIGYGDESGTFAMLNFLHGKDDTNSVALPEQKDSSGSAIYPEAKENYVGTLNVGVAFSSAVRLAAELGVSMMTHDLRLESRDGFFPQADGAAKMSLMIVPANNWSVNLNASWIGPGYYTLGYVQLPNDLMEFTVAPAARFFDNKLSLRGSLGVMLNNLRSNRLSTTQRIIGSLNVSAQPTERFGIEANYSNYGMRSSHVNDTLRVQFVSQSASITPHYAFEWLDGTNSLSAAYSLQDLNNANPLANGSNSLTHTLSLAHAISFPSTLSFSTSAMQTAFTAGGLSTSILNVSETASKQFFENTLTASLTFGYNIVTSDGARDGQFTGQATASYSFDRFGTLSASVMNNTYRFDRAIDSPSFEEWNAHVQYNIHF